MTMLHVNEYIPWPNKLDLWFSGDVTCYRPFWSWAFMDATDLFASDRGSIETKLHRTHVWAGTIALGKALAWLVEQRKWKGELCIKTHLRDVLGAIGRIDDPMMLRIHQLLQGTKWTVQPCSGDENEFTRSLCREAYKEWGK